MSWTYVKNTRGEWEIKECDSTQLSADFIYYVNSTDKPLDENIKGLLRMHNVKHGKWCAYTTVDQWKLIHPQMMKSQKLGKIGMYKYRISNKNVTILVYTKDFDNKLELSSVAAQLRKCGVVGRMYWKPDAYTLLNIYAKNPYGIKPYFFVDDEKENKV